MDRLAQPGFLRAFHGRMTVLWAVLIPVSILTPLRNSIAWVVGMSAWANFVGHFASWQAARVECRQAEAEDQASDLA